MAKISSANKRGVVVVAGASAGAGRAIVREFARRGASMNRGLLAIAGVGLAAGAILTTMLLRRAQVERQANEQVARFRAGGVI